MTTDPMLSAHEPKELRRKALAIAEAGLKAADGGIVVREKVRLVEGGVSIGGITYPLRPGNKLIILGGGKATLPVARSLEEVFGGRIDAGAIVLRRGETADLERLDVHHADHPLPTSDSVRAATRIVDLARQAGPGDLVVTCFTGGRSSLLSLPPPGVSLEDKRRLNEALIGSGMPIDEINTVRKHVSLIKGGRLANLIAPARIVNLTISDVASDALDILADLTTQDTSTPARAIAVLERFGLINEIPASVKQHLDSPASRSPDLTGLPIENFMLTNGANVCAAMAAAARSEGLKPEPVLSPLEGEAREIGDRVAGLAMDSEPLTAILGCGGEGTVRLGRSEFGRGGPNQEAALAAALHLEGQSVAAVFIDTDGSDGGTDVAGAICDGETAQRARRQDLDLSAAIAAHRALTPLNVLGDLIETGPTGTNVNDLFVAVVGPE